MVILELPWPPSVNHYWRMGHGHMYLASEGRRYAAIVAGAVRLSRITPFTGDVSLAIEACPPDKRRRDLDNLQKSIWDSLGKAGLYADDSQVKHVEAWMLAPVKDGKVVIRIADYDSGNHNPIIQPSRNPSLSHTA